VSTDLGDTVFEIVDDVAETEYGYGDEDVGDKPKRAEHVHSNRWRLA
jgi:hypothetical protein